MSRVLFAVTTRRGIEAVLPLMQELKTRGHTIQVVAINHPPAGLKYPHEFMVRDDEKMLGLLEGVAATTAVIPEYNEKDFAVTVFHLQPDIFVNKGDGGSPRDRGLIAIFRQISDAPVLCQQVDWHVDFNFTLPMSDYFNVSGGRWKAHLIRRGMAGDRTQVTGYPKSDYLIKYSENVTRRDDIVVMSHPDWTPEARDYIKRHMLALQEATGRKIVIKLHPMSEQFRTGDYDYWTESSQETTDMIVTSHSDPYVLMSTAALVVTSWSNSGYEAMQMGASVVIANVGMKEELYAGCGVECRMIPQGAGSSQIMARDLAAMCIRVLCDGLTLEESTAITEWKRNQYYYADGRCSDRAASHIEEVLDKEGKL